MRFIIVLVIVSLICSTGLALSTAPEGNWTVTLGKDVKLEFVLIPKGTFIMGSPETEPNREQNEGPQRTIKITKPFYMAKYPITKAQFAAFVKSTHYKTDAQKNGYAAGIVLGQWGRLPGATWDKPGFDQTNQDPVICVSLNDDAAFCQWVSKITKKSVRFPTEAEWEYACRGGTQTAFSWGQEVEEAKDCLNAEDGKQGWLDGYRYTSPVGTFKPNRFGLYDMLGNVWQPCSDWYAKSYNPQDIVDPKGPPTGKDHIIRGGSWDYPPSFCRCAWRMPASLDGASWDSGFRVVADVL